MTIRLQDKYADANCRPKYMLRLNTMLFFLLGVGVFALGSVSGQLNVLLKTAALLFFLPKLSTFKFRMAEIVLLAIFSFIAMFQIIIQASLKTASLEMSFLINVILLVLIGKLEVRKSSVTDRSVYTFFLLASLAQIFIFFMVTGEGMLLRGDRNHSAVIVTLLIFSYSYFFKTSNFTVLIIFINKSRNLLVGIFVFLFRDLFTTLFHKRKFLMFSLLLVGLFSINYLYFLSITYFDITNYGSENNLSRLLVIFDGSNSYRFRLNNEFIAMVLGDWKSFIINTGIYSDLIDLQGLYPHNSYLQLIYRAGILRGCLYVFLIILLVRKNNAALIVALFFQSMFIHDVLSTNVILLAFIMSKFNVIEAKFND